MVGFSISDLTTNWILSKMIEILVDSEATISQICQEYLQFDID